MKISDLQKILAEALAHSGDIVVLYDFRIPDGTGSLNELDAAMVSSVTNPDGQEELAFMLLSHAALDELSPASRAEMKKAAQALIEH